MVKTLKKGFSLIELTIVVIIVSLLIAGIVEGSRMISQAGLQTVIQEFKKVRLSFVNFTDQYDGMPGDLENASSYWSGTPDGNGNNIIDPTLTETNLVWTHLALANFIPGSFDGTTQLFKSKAFREGYVGLRSMPWLAISPSAVNYHSIEYGTQLSTSTYGAHGALLSPKQSYLIDKKIDDGVAYTGMVIGNDGLNPLQTDSTCACPAYNTACSTDYDLTQTGKQCWLVYKIRKKK